MAQVDDDNKMFPYVLDRDKCIRTQTQTQAYTHTRFLSKKMNVRGGKQPEQRAATQKPQCANCFCRLDLAAHSVGARSVTEGH